MSAKKTAKLSFKFQISIPKAVRTARLWQAGQEFAFIPNGEGVLLMPVPKREYLAVLTRAPRLPHRIASAITRSEFPRLES